MSSGGRSMIADTAAKSLTTALEVRVVTGAGGGPEKTILNTPRFLRDYGYETVCAYMHPPGDPGFETLQRRAEEWEAPLISIPDRGMRDVGVIKRVAKLCRQHNVKIWHGHDYKSNILGLLLRPFHRMKLVTTVHGWVNREGNMPLYSKIDRWCLPKYQHVICVSKDLHEECEDLGVRADRLTLIENAIDETQFVATTNPTAAKIRFGLPVDRPVIGAVGRLAEEKGFHFLLDAFARLIHEGHKVTLAIVGDGTARPDLERRRNSLGLGNHVRFLGFQEDTRTIYHAMDIFCLSSLREGLPNVLLESLACEVPSIATDLPGVRQVINEPGVQSLIVPPGESEPLYVALRQLLVEETPRRDLAVAGRKRIIEQFSFRRRIKRIASIYDELQK